MSFLEVAQELMGDEATKAAYDADPDAFLAARGFDGLTPAEVAEAVGFVADTLPVEAAARVTDGDAALDGLARLDPATLEPDPETSSDPEAPDLAGAGLWEHDPSGELDVVPPDEAGGDDGGQAGAAPSDEDGSASPFARLSDDEPEPGFGVGWEPGDADDVTAASPEFANLTEHPFDTELDATHLPDLALEASDPINEAIHWADHEAGHEPSDPLDHGSDAHDHAGHDGSDGDHLDL